MIKDWIDIIRSADYFNLVPKNQNMMLITDPLHGGRGAEGVGTLGVETEYDKVFSVDSIPEEFEGLPPKFIAMTNAQSLVDNNDLPHAADPAPAQRCGNVAFVWGTPTNRSEMTRINRIFSFADRIYLHREDGFPALIEAVGLAKHYYHGKLHRKGQHPAIKADYIFAHWYYSGKNFRNNGPAVICIKDYKEYWNDGVFIGHKWSSISPFWKCRDLIGPADEDTLSVFLENIRGKTNLFSNTYFTDPEDEVVYMTDFT